MLHLGGYWRR